MSGQESLVLGIAIFVLALLAIAFGWAWFNGRRIRGALSSILGALDYHAGHLSSGNVSPNATYNGTWAETHEILARDRRFSLLKRDVELAFQMLERFRESRAGADETFAEISRVQTVVGEALASISSSTPRRSGSLTQ